MKIGYLLIIACIFLLSGVPSAGARHQFEYMATLSLTGLDTTITYSIIANSTEELLPVDGVFLRYYWTSSRPNITVTVVAHPLNQTVMSNACIVLLPVFHVYFVEFTLIPHYADYPSAWNFEITDAIPIAIVGITGVSILRKKMS